MAPSPLRGDRTVIPLSFITHVKLLMFSLAHSRPPKPEERLLSKHVDNFSHFTGDKIREIDFKSRIKDYTWQSV